MTCFIPNDFTEMMYHYSEVVSLRMYYVAAFHMNQVTGKSSTSGGLSHMSP